MGLLTAELQLTQNTKKKWRWCVVTLYSGQGDDEIAFFHYYYSFLPFSCQTFLHKMGLSGIAYVTLVLSACIKGKVKVFCYR